MDVNTATCRIRSCECLPEPMYVSASAVYFFPPQCHRQRGVETVDHFLFRCPLWSEYRIKIRQLAGSRWGGHLVCTCGEDGLDLQKMGCSKDGSQTRRWLTQPSSLQKIPRGLMTKEEERKPRLTLHTYIKPFFSWLRLPTRYFRGSASTSRLLILPPSILLMDWSSKLGIATSNTAYKPGS